MTTPRTTAALLRASLVLGALCAASQALAQHALLLRDGQPAAVPVPGGALSTLVERVLEGPDASQLRAGWSTALPTDVPLLDVVRHRDDAGVLRVQLHLGKRFLLLLRRAEQLELAVEQLAKTVFANDPAVGAVDLFVEDLDGALRPLPELLFRAGVGPDPRQAGEVSTDSAGGPRVLQSSVQGALSGRTIAVSPGHGYYWHSTLGWTTQRGQIDGLTEDIHTAEIAFRYLIPYLENMGARVVSCRERGFVDRVHVLDNDAGGGVYSESGSWSTSGSAGFNGGTYRYVQTSPAGGTSATWQVVILEDGRYPVYAWYRAGSNRANDARYTIRHAGGEEVVTIDQRGDDSTWTFLGEYWFRAGDTARVTLSNESNDPGKVVIADTIRIGAGFGSIARGNGTSGRSRWLECSRYYAQFAGAPASVWNSLSSGEDNGDDVTCRPRFAEWRGADAFVSLHTNAGGGTGTDSFIYNGGATAGSSTLANRIQSQIVADVRAEYDATWVDRGVKQANFGEVRLLSSMPGVLVELAFHDTAGSRDHQALHDPEFRRIAARAYARGVLRYFDLNAVFPPEPPRGFRVIQDGARGLRLAWLGTSSATEYAIEQAPDGKSFTEVGRTNGQTWSTGPLPAGTVLSFRVRALNQSGRSFPTEVLVAGTSHRNGPADVLLVQGFERLDRSVKTPDNTFDYLPRHAAAIRDAGDFSLAFDAASKDAVRFGFAPLASYRAVDWACGEESTGDESFDSLEQTLVRSYLAGGGRLLVSGSEIGWDLDARGSATDRDFHRNVLGATYVRDDAGTYSFREVAGERFAGLGTASFDDGSAGTYDVDYPDVLSATDGNSRVVLEYATANVQGAAIERDDGTSRVVYLGFPLETVRDAGDRAFLMNRALRFLLAPRLLDAPETVALGASAPLRIEAPLDANRTYVLACSLRTDPVTPLPGGGILPLEADALFVASLDPTSPVFRNFIGRLDGQGRATASFVAPPTPLLLGLPLYFSGFTLAQDSPPTLGRVLPWVRITIR